MREQQAKDRPPISIDECRSHLTAAGDGLSDLQIEQLRDQLYGLARTAAAMFDSAPASSFDGFIAGLPGRDIADLEERAAIIEFDGGLRRDHAERLAFAAHLLDKQ